MTKPGKETEAEAKRTKEVIAVAVDTRDDFDEVLEKHTFWRVIRNSTWIRRFLQNCHSKKSNRASGPLTTAETEKQVKWWIKREQERYSVTEKFLGDQQRLNLQKNDEEIFACRGRIQGHYPFVSAAQSKLIRENSARRSPLDSSRGSWVNYGAC